MSESSKREKDIDALVTAQADDESAWEPAVHVEPRRTWRLTRSSAELAARYFVLSSLHLLGAHVAAAWDANDVDIALLDDEGSLRATLEVKPIIGAARWRIQDIRARRSHFVVFVHYVAQHPQRPPEIYVLPSLQLRDLLARSGRLDTSLSELEAALHGRDGWSQLMEPAV